MSLRAVVFVSEAASLLVNDLHGLVSPKLDSVIDDASRFNRDAGVSGVILFDGRRFFGYLEGPQDGLAVAYSRALGAASHAAVSKLWLGKVPRRLVPFWALQCLPVESNQISTLIHLFETESSLRAPSCGISAVAREYLAQIVAPYRPARDSET